MTSVMGMKIIKSGIRRLKYYIRVVSREKSIGRAPRFATINPISIVPQK